MFCAGKIFQHCYINIISALVSVIRRPVDVFSCSATYNSENDNHIRGNGLNERARIMHTLRRFSAVWRRNRTPQHRYRWLIATIVFLVVATVAQWRNSRAGQRQGVPGIERADRPAEAAILAQVVLVSPTITPQWQEATGTVQPELEAPISSKVTARVQNVLVR